MEFTDEKLQKMSKKRIDTFRYSKFLERYHYGERGKQHISDFPEMFERMRNCLDFWEWDLYQDNKLLDLKKVNRCRTRWCPNCRKVTLANNILEFMPKYADMRRKGYNPYLLTLTQPNVSDDELEFEIRKISKTFSKFWRWFNGEIGVNGYRDRILNCVGAVKFLEITRKNNSNHPHLHVLVFSDGNESENDFVKHITGEWSDKRKSFNMLSHADLQVREMWYKAYNSIRSTKEIDEDFYICDIRECNPEGIFEVFKYCFKDTDIRNYSDFEVIYKAILGKRLKQGYGELYDLELVEEGEEEKEKEDNISDYLLVNCDELPSKLITEFKKLLDISLHEFKKISRFNTSKIIDKIQD